MRSCKECKHLTADWGYTKCGLNFWRISHDSKSPIAKDHFAFLDEIMTVADDCQSFLGNAAGSATGIPAKDDM